MTSEVGNKQLRIVRVKKIQIFREFFPLVLINFKSVDCQLTWVDLSVGGDSVRVHEHLEGLGELVGAVEGRRNLVRLYHLKERRDRAAH